MNIIKQRRNSNILDTFSVAILTADKRENLFEFKRFLRE